MNGNWCVVRTQPRRERWAKLNVERQGNQTLLPVFQPDPESPPKILFPSYLFVKMIEGHWWFLKSTFGCLAPIMLYDEPAKVPEHVMEQLLASCDDTGFMTFNQFSYAIGQRVRIRAGSFINQIGIYDGSTSQDRVRVLLDMLGSQIPVSLSQGYLEPYSA